MHKKLNELNVTTKVCHEKDYGCSAECFNEWNIWILRFNEANIIREISSCNLK